MLHELITWLASTVGQWGYPGILILMFLESSFFPFPSEVVIPPAGYLAATGQMNIGLVLLFGTLGSLLGAMFNYWLAIKCGRPFFERYGRYLLIKRSSLDKADEFFNRHGHVSTFVGRLLPGIRQYISLPAGLARMNLPLFCLSTALGAGIWVTVLAMLGYMFGRNQQAIMQHLHRVGIILAVVCVAIVIVYWWRWGRRAAEKEDSGSDVGASES